MAFIEGLSDGRWAQHQPLPDLLSQWGKELVRPSSRQGEIGKIDYELLRFPKTLEPWLERGERRPAVGSRGQYRSECIEDYEHGIVVVSWV